METLPKRGPAQVQAASCTAVLVYPFIPLWGAKGISLVSVGCQDLLPFPDQHQVPAQGAWTRVGVSASCHWNAAMDWSCVYTFCAASLFLSHGKELAKHTGILLIAFKAAFRKTTALKDGCVEIRPAGGNLVQWRYCLSCIRGVWHRARGMTFCRRGEEFFRALRPVWSPDS